MEFDDKEQGIFDEMMEVVERHPTFKRYRLRTESILRFQKLIIDCDRRKVYHNRKEINLTNKEFNILCLLASNQGRVMTYEQIYEQVWGDCGQDVENNTIGYHICNLKEKLFAVASCSSFRIRCVRGVGYCFELKSEEAI